MTNDLANKTDGFQLDRTLQRLTLEGITYTPSNIHRLKKNAIRQTPDMLQDIYHFLQDWFNDSPTIRVFTSGSTGTPKELVVRKDQMMRSACLTCGYLDLRKGDKALLCMSLRYIAGKMVVIRALVAGLDLVIREPSGHPLADVTESLRFAAMIPMQVYNSLRVAEERARLAKIEILIIGGGAIDTALEEEIRSLPHAVYSTYGMTETLSHIALRRLNGPDASACYHPFPSVNLSLSSDNTLVIDAPLVSDERLVTNDVARILPDGSFLITGRKDNIVNSGGIKIQIEEVEEALRPYLDVPFAITSAPDAKFGEVLVLLLGGLPTQGKGVSGQDNLPLETEQVRTLVNGHLTKYQYPRHILRVEAIPQTGSGKVDRPACRETARNIISKTHTK